MPGPVFLRGDRVDLHPIEESDLPFLVEATNDPDVWRTLRSRSPTNRQQEREWFEGLAARDGVVLLVLAGGDPAGTVGYGDVDGNGGTAEVGYAVHPDHWGNGYAAVPRSRVATAFGVPRSSPIRRNADEARPGPQFSQKYINTDANSAKQEDLYTSRLQVSLSPDLPVKVDSVAFTADSY